MINLERIPPHQAFLKELLRGRSMEAYVALMFLDAGLTVQMGKLKMAATPEDGLRFGDQRDLRANDRRVEVKSTTYAWNGPEDWPFHRVFVCRPKFWEVANPKPVAFVMVSQQTLATMFVWSHPDTWDQDDRVWDHNRGYYVSLLCAPLSELRPTSELIAWLETQ